MNFLFFVTILMWSNQLFAKSTPLVRSTEVSKVAYEQFLLHHPLYSSYIETLKDSSNDAEVANLQSLFFQAQKSFLLGSLSEAKKEFLQVTQEFNRRHWSRTEKNLIAFAFLRLAQIDKNQQGQWIKEAHHYHPSYILDQEIFPPSFQNQWRVLQKTSLGRAWFLNHQVSQFDELIVNGTKFQLPRISRIDLRGNHSFLVTLKSNAYRQQTFKGSYSELISWTPELTPLAFGNCQQLIGSNFGQIDIAVLFKDDCVYDPKHKVIEPQKLLPNRLSNSSNLKLGALAKSPAEEQLPPKSWYKNKWVWLGILGGAVTAAVFDNLNRDKESRVIPRHTSN